MAGPPRGPTQYQQGNRACNEKADGKTINESQVLLLISCSKTHDNCTNRMTELWAKHLNAKLSSNKPIEENGPWQHREQHEKKKNHHSC